MNHKSLTKIFRYAETGTKRTADSFIKENNEQLNHATDRDRTTNRTATSDFYERMMEKST